MDYSEYVEEQVTRNQWKTLQELDVTLDTRYLAEIWPDFVAREQRLAHELPFLEEQLSEYENPRIFDAGMGSGATTIGLKRAGYDVVSNEIDDDLVDIAQDEAQKEGLELEVTQHDWRNLSDEYREAFHAVVLLGNSLTYLFEREDQHEAVKNFRNILRPNGKLIIDQRNYADRFGTGDYATSGNFVYCGEKVRSLEIYTEKDMTVIEYSHEDHDRSAHLVLYPFDERELETILRSAGFDQVHTYHPYSKTTPKEQAEFITHVARE